MPRKVAIKDTNIFIDMESMGILDLWLQLGIETITSSLVVQELEAGQHLQSLAYIKSTQIKALSSPLEPVAEIMGEETGISMPDASLLHLAIEHEAALLLTGDKALRNAAEARAVECHGSIWILDQLVLNKKVTGVLAVEKLNGLLSLEGEQKRYLPRNAVNEYIRRWSQI